MPTPAGYLGVRFCEHREPVIKNAECYETRSFCRHYLRDIHIDKNNRPYILDCGHFTPPAEIFHSLQEYLIEKRQHRRDKRRGQRRRKSVR